MADPWQALDAIGLLPDDEIDPAVAALQLARLEADGRGWQAAASHLTDLATRAASLGAVLSGRSPEERVGALAGLIHADFGYRGDSETYDDLDNANLIRVIARRRGLPVALGILWLHCIRAAGWKGWGIDFPGHFLVGLAPGRDDAAAASPAILIDAFAQGAIAGAAELSALLRRIAGADRPILPGMLRPMATRDVLLRLQRNLAQRRMQAADWSGALRSTDAMLRVAPDIASGWLNAADLHRRLGQIEPSIACLERFLALVPDSDASMQARAQIAALRRQI